MVTTRSEARHTSFGLFAFRICSACSWRGCPSGQPAAQQQHNLAMHLTACAGQHSSQSRWHGADARSHKHGAQCALLKCRQTQTLGRWPLTKA